ncbi:MAG: hypothetical protein NC251_08895 [Lachnoclostridium sp.]|nr:hypothetical protein [Lachnospira sp.]MCM1248533.1 hypothetical protein [Lachnoclostridium sp.]
MQKKTCLREKTCLFNPYVAEKCVGGDLVYRVCQEQYYAYDEWERLIYADLPGEGEYYFCYEETSMEDSMEASMVPYAFLEVYPRFCSFNRLAKEDYSFMDVPKGGEEAFLRQAGLTKEDILHEYQWQNESGDGIVWSHEAVCLTVYYDKEKETGCGYFAYPKEDFTDMSGFMFRGCEKIKLSETEDPYGVLAPYYTEGKPYISFIPLEDMFQWESSSYECKYDKDRLMYIWMYGTGSDTERFYIYEDDNDMPAYCLNVRRGTNDGITLFEFEP